MLRRIILASAALLGLVSADLTITSPGPNDWWVASSVNTISWTCTTSQFQNFTVLISNPATLPQGLAIIAVQENYDCSKTITQQQSAQPAGTGYVVQFANTLNSTDIYAQSQSFEIKALGSSYPTTTSGVSSSATGSTGSAQATSTTAASGGALAHYIPVGMSMAAALALGLVVA